MKMNRREAQSFKFGQHFAQANLLFVWLHYAFTTQIQKTELLEGGVR